ncbi:unannotated protein [freshwater metagenome]|uniref:Unannotated protein n=1 Tax=freshwater metagenome TaxID=449393 RepID=A0A6J7HZS3_9ZZZZ|nr:thioredoxin domain-containing protein [Actinomycetota bacterium]
MTDLTSASAPHLREHDHVRGPEGAPVVVVYADFTCGPCALAALRLAQVPLRVVHRHLVLRRRDRRAEPVAIAAEAAARQGAFWAFHDALFSDQGRLDDPHLWQRCEALGLDVDAFELDRRDQALAARVAGETREALRAGAATTPLLILPDGTLQQGAPSAAMLAALGARAADS